MTINCEKVIKALEACFSALTTNKDTGDFIDLNILQRCAESTSQSATLARVAWQAHEALTSLKKVTSWNYHQHGEHTFFRMIEWCFDVNKGDTVLGYQEWVEHKLEELLYETDLEGVDAIEVAGCIEIDRNVSVITEERAEFFSVYTRVANEGVECICDFNTKGHALEFAKALAIRTGIPVHGNLCKTEEV